MSRDIHANILSALASDQIKVFNLMRITDANNVVHGFTDCGVILIDPVDGTVYNPRPMKRGDIKYSRTKIVDSISGRLDDKDQYLQGIILGDADQQNPVQVKAAVLDIDDNTFVENPICWFDGFLDKWKSDEEYFNFTITNEISKWNQITTTKFSPSCRWKVFRGPECLYGYGAELANDPTLAGTGGSLGSGPGSESGTVATGYYLYCDTGGVVVASKGNGGQILDVNAGTLLALISGNDMSIVSGTAYRLVVDVFEYTGAAGDLNIKISLGGGGTVSMAYVALKKGRNIIDFNALLTNTGQRFVISMSSASSAYRATIANISLREVTDATVTECDRSYSRCSYLNNTANFSGARWLPSILDKTIWWGRNFGEKN